MMRKGLGVFLPTNGKGYIDRSRVLRGPAFSLILEMASMADMQQMLVEARRAKAVR
jgi:hypothetical protein